MVRLHILVLCRIRYIQRSGLDKSGYLFLGSLNTSKVIFLSKRAVDMTFQALYTLTDLRVILRETAPHHDLDEKQRAQVQRLLENLERQVGSLKQEMLK